MKLSTLKLDSLRLLIPLEKVINPNHTEFGRIITTVNDDGEILSTKENHTYRLKSLQFPLFKSYYYYAR
jgi:hypothetical protein